ncbi:MAG: hypothetical protein Q8K70_10365 [Bacteroidota bacterium]|nr:hypothetical protein [Bacteroidota bacterium]
MIFTGNENHHISLQEASEITANFRNNMPPNGIIAHYFGKNAILNILNQPLCVGMRIYYALDNIDQPKLVLVGTDMNGNDIVNGNLAEFSIPCPTHCSDQNALNS